MRGEMEETGRELKGGIPWEREREGRNKREGRERDEGRDGGDRQRVERRDTMGEGFDLI